MIRDENYYVVHGWMLNKLGLKGNNLIIYALLYGFSQDKESEFMGSIDYIRDFTGASRDTIRLSLSRLEELGYIVKNSRNKEFGKTNSYTCVSLDKIKEIRGVAENKPPQKLQSYNGLLDDFGVYGEYRNAIFRFIAHLKVSFNLVMLNNRLENIIVKLDLYYFKNIDKVKAIDEVIAKGYRRFDFEIDEK